MQENPLKIPILTILKASSDALSEYELIRHLEADFKAFEMTGNNNNLALFRKHFMVMNALYQLQESLLKEGLYLAISALSIKLESTKENNSSLPTEGSDAKLRAYYLDWSQLNETTTSDVDALLNNFWKHYCAHDKHTQALDILGVTNSDDWTVIQQTYRKLAAKFHPDRGGDKAQFIAVREAYEILRLNQTLYNQK